MTEINKIVIKFKDSKIMKGTTNDFFPNKKHFHIHLQGNEAVPIDVERLKAIFFVKDFQGNKAFKEAYKDVMAGGGKKIKVKFSDGEVIIGFSLGYSPGRHGFFLVPADLKSNNQRIFVITSATERIEVQ